MARKVSCKRCDTLLFLLYPNKVDNKMLHTLLRRHSDVIDPHKIWDGITMSEPATQSGTLPATEPTFLETELQRMTNANMKLLEEISVLKQQLRAAQRNVNFNIQVDTQQVV